ncbi:MAG: type III pantothenate kinase [Chlorobiaceae bacterium]|nr:type III pantothenate kinase [Chlorobiaceae bacterium]NTW73895.1 type III pantothenate kinase [Chlorobiaceae bacterium]
MERQHSRATGDISRLVVVIGNTSTTMVIFPYGREPLTERLPSSVFADPVVMGDTLVSLALRFGPFLDAAVCSVVPDIAAHCAEQLNSKCSVPAVMIGSEMLLPFTLRYENRSAFGADRIALCAWSCQQFAQQAHIAVDIGTAITFDVLDSRGQYVGGLIMPGIDMMSGALHSRTAQLPLVSIDRSTSLLGRSTGECIRSGIFWGVVKQIEGLIREISRYLAEEFGEPSVGVIVTGGNSRLIAAEIGCIDVVDELAVARGSLLLLDLNPPGAPDSRSGS